MSHPEHVCFDPDDLLDTKSTQRCRNALREASGDNYGPIERHSLRVAFIMRELARVAALPLDDEVAVSASLLHDIGLFDPDRRRRFYLARGRHSADELVNAFGWGDARRTLCLDAIELHHRLVPQWTKGTEVELLRLADLVDASRGLVRFSVDREWLRALFRTIPRQGLQQALLRHSVRGAPCLASGIAGTVLNAPRRRVPRPR